jgi:hypothetical protein
MPRIMQGTNDARHFDSANAPTLPRPHNGRRRPPRNPLLIRSTAAELSRIEQADALTICLALADADDDAEAWIHR